MKGAGGGVIEGSQGETQGDEYEARKKQDNLKKGRQMETKREVDEESV